MNKQEVEAIIEKLGGVPESYSCPYCPVDTNDVLIGDVLAQIHESGKYHAGVYTDLVWTWINCGFSRSLQEIVSKSGYEHEVKAVPVGNMKYKAVEDSHQVLKSKDATALLTFIKNLFE